jgi:alkaline phosphatase
MKVGLVSDTRITHATPAAFYAHSTDRDSEYEIAEQLIESDIDLALSGGKSAFLPRANTLVSDSSQDSGAGHGNRADGQDLIQRWRERGYPVVQNALQLASHTTTPLLGLFAKSCMHDAFLEGKDGEPTLAAMTKAALRLLDNPGGFVLMVEAGQIDFAGHDNDGGWVLAEMLRLNSALGVIEEFTRNRDDTLVLLTGDHETGGMGFSYHHPVKPEGMTHGSPSGSSKANDVFVTKDALRALRSQRATIESISHSFEELPMTERTPDALRELTHDLTGYSINPDTSRWIAGLINGQLHNQTVVDTLITPFYSKRTARYALFARALGAQLGLTWSSGNHTSTPIFIVSSGPGSASFRGWFQTREIGQLLKSLVKKR